MSNPRLKLSWSDHPKYPSTKVAPLPDGSSVTIFLTTNTAFIEHIRGRRSSGIERTYHPVGDPLDQAKQVAEEWAAEAYPLAALGQLAKDNPVDYRDKLEKLEALRRGAKTPGERQAAEAAIERTTRRWMKEQEAAYISGQVQEDRARLARPEQRQQSAVFAEARKRVEATLRKTLGSVVWSKLDRDARSGLVNEAIALWIERGRPANAWRDIANHIRRAHRSRLEKDVQFGEYDKDELADEFVSPEARQEAAERSAAGDRAANVRDEMAAESPLGKMRVSLVELHIGEKVFPGQPRRLLGSQPRKDLARHHPPGGKDCPTCKAIARFVRIAGLTPDAVGRNVDETLVEMRQRMGE